MRGRMVGLEMCTSNRHMGVIQQKTGFHWAGWWRCHLRASDITEDASAPSLVFQTCSLVLSAYLNDQRPLKVGLKGKK